MIDATFKRLHLTLERGAEQNTKGSDVAAALERNFSTLANPLHVQQQSKQSRDKVLGSEELEWRGTSYQLSKHNRDFVLQISDLLHLDEFSSFVLLRNLLLYELKEFGVSAPSSRASSSSSPSPTGESVEWRQPTLLEVLDYFFEERLCILLCLCSILRIADDAEERYHAECRGVADRLIATGLLQTLHGSLFASELPPSNLDGQQALRERWARSQLELQEAVLKILFLAYYNRVSCSGRDLKQLVSKCQKEAFGGRPKTLPLLDESGRDTLARIKHLAVLLLLECMNLEGYVGAGAPVTRRLDSRTVEEVTQRLTSSRADLPQYGPIFLAWAALLEQFCRDGDGDRRGEHDSAYATTAAAFGAIEQSKIALGEQGLRLGAVDYLHDVLASGLFEQDSNMIGYRCVVQGFISLLLAAFPKIVATPRLVDLYRQVFEENLLASAQFWQRDFELPERRLLFDQTRRQFPHRLLPYVGLVTALVHDTESAQRVQVLLEQAQIFASEYTTTISAAETSAHRRGASADDDDDDGGADDERIVLARPCAVPISDLYTAAEANIQLPAGTHGVKQQVSAPAARQSAKTATALTTVVWFVEYSAFDIFVAIIDAFLARAALFQLRVGHVEQITAILSLFARLLPFQSDRTADSPADPLLALTPLLLPRLLDLLQKTTALVNSPRYAHDVLPRLAESQQRASVAPRLCEMMRACIECIELYARVNPSAVWIALERCQLLEGFGQRRSGTASSAATHIPSVFFALEAPTGRYPVTISFLRLIRTLLAFLKSWRVARRALTDDSDIDASAYRRQTTLPAASSFVNDDNDDNNNNNDDDDDDDDAAFLHSKLLASDAFEPALYYLRTDVLGCFARGRFARISERWHMGTCFLEIVEALLSDPTLGSSHAAESSWVKSIAFESSFHHTLLSIVATGHSFLEKWRLRHVKQAQLLESLLLLGLSVLERLLLLDEKGRVRQTLLSRTIGKDNVHLVFVVASYIYYAHNASIPLVATRILTHLCKPPPGTTRAVSLLGHLGGNEERLRTVFLQRLARRSESLRLRVAIVDLLTSCLEHQPGMADMFINLPRSEEQRSARVARRQSGAGEPADSCLDVVVSIVSAKRGGNLDDSPELFAAAVSLLHTLWRLAAQHQSTIRYLRTLSDFWAHLVNPLIDKINPHIFTAAADATLAAAAGGGYAAGGGIEAPTVDEELRIPDVEAVRECFRIVSRAWTLKILTLEILHEQASGLDQQLRQQLAAIQDSQVRWMNSFCRVHFNGDVTRELESMARRLGVPIRRALSQGPQRTYGTSYVYDLALVSDKLRHVRDVADVRQLVGLVEQTNRMFSLADAELLLLNSWCRFVQITAYCGIVNYMPSSSNDAALVLISGLANFLEMETRRSFLVIKKLCEISALLESLLHIRLALPLSSDQVSARLQLEKLLSNLVKTVRRVNSHLALFPASLGARRDDDPSYQMLLSIQRCLLSSVFFLLGPGQPLNFAGLCLELLPQLGLALAYPPLLDVALSSLQRAVGSHLAASDSQVQPEAYTAILRDGAICATVLQLLATCIDRQHSPATALLAAHLLLSLAQEVSTAEALLTSGLMMQLTSRSFGRLATSAEPYDTVQGCRNTWHQIWCLQIMSVCSLIRTMGYSLSFLDQALRFVAIHFDRLTRSLRLPAALTLAGLEETQCITELFAQLAAYPANWASALGQRVHGHQQRMLALMASCVNLLLNLGTLHESCEPVTKQERSDAKKPVAAGDERPTGAAAARQHIEERVFFRQIEEALLVCLLNTLSFVRRNSPDPRWFVSDRKVADIDPESLTALFSPVAESLTPDDGVLPLGIVAALLEWCLQRLDLLHRQQQTFKTRELIFQLVAEAAYIVAGHIGLFIWKSHGDAPAQRSLQTKFSSLEQAMRSLANYPECADMESTWLPFLAELNVVGKQAARHPAAAMTTMLFG